MKLKVYINIKILVKQVSKDQQKQLRYRFLEKNILKHYCFIFLFGKIIIFQTRFIKRFTHKYFLSRLTTFLTQNRLKTKKLSFCKARFPVNIIRHSGFNYKSIKIGPQILPRYDLNCFNKHCSRANPWTKSTPQRQLIIKEYFSRQRRVHRGAFIIKFVKNK